ncbi:MAG: hypothetical protein RLZZ135_2129 [Cyanobacteriota bacterium]|jgi:uncharacterized membrane protein
MLTDANEINNLQSLPESILKNIETIIELETEHGRNIPTHQRMLERAATVCGKPRFLYGQIIFFSTWWLCSQLVKHNLLHWDLPTFNLHEEGLDVASLLISTGVLIYQTRQEKLAEERSHLTLQLNLLTEQKIAKLIALVEELRSDLPNVPDRLDIEAEEMQKNTDPQALLVVIKENLDRPESPDLPESSADLAENSELQTTEQIATLNLEALD